MAQFCGYANNLFTSTGAASVATSGNCAGSYFDKSNYWTGQLLQWRDRNDLRATGKRATCRRQRQCAW
jgi:hypothetical protein